MYLPTIPREAVIERLLEAAQTALKEVEILFSDNLPEKQAGGGPGTGGAYDLPSGPKGPGQHPGHGQRRCQGRGAEKALLPGGSPPMCGGAGRGEKSRQSEAA